MWVGDYTFGAVYSFDDIGGYAEYVRSPIHRKVSELGLPLIENMVSFDIAEDADPGLADRIVDLNRARLAGDEELTKLISGLKSYSGSALAK